MSWKTSVGIFVIIFSSCKQEKVAEIDSSVSFYNDVSSPYLIEVNEFKILAQNPNIKIIDFRKKELYLEEHIEGAQHIWRSDIEDTSFHYGGMMATSNQIESLFSKLGINSTDTLIIYDDKGLCEAARLWWILQNYDFKNVRLFHGGIEAWKAENGAISKITPFVKETAFKLTSTPTMKFHFSKEELQAALKNNIVIIDTRSHDEYSGNVHKKGAAKGGRIPKSIHIDWAETINYNGDKKFRSIEELANLYNQYNIKVDDPIIVYCHSGVRSAHTTFVLTELLGFKNVKNYDGSWIEWSHFDELEFEKDSLGINNS